DAGRPNVRTIRRVRRRDRHRVRIRIADQQTAEGIGQRIAYLHVMLATGGWNEHWRIDGSAAEVVFSIRAGSEICRVTIQPGFYAPLPGVPRGGQRKVDLSVEQVPECRHHRPRRAIERLE